MYLSVALGVEIFVHINPIMLHFSLHSNRGVYPSEIIPLIMEAPADDKQKFCTEQLLSEVKAAVQSLRVGYLRILRACRCISQVFEASNC